MTTTPCPRCRGDKTVETLHPSYGTRDCPEAYSEIDCPRCDGAGVILITEILRDVLYDVAAYLDNYADVDTGPNGEMVGNAALRLLTEVEDAIARVERRA